MIQRFILGAIGVVIGIVMGMMFMMALHMASTLVYPLPEDVSFASQEPENLERLNEWFGTLPTGAWLLATVCHGLGCMSGAVIAMFVSGRRSLIPAIVVGIVFTICGVMNLSSLPHPTWFPFLDVPVYLAFAFVAGKLLRRDTSDDIADNNEPDAQAESEAKAD